MRTLETFEEVLGMALRLSLVGWHRVKRRTLKGRSKGGMPIKNTFLTK